LDVLSYAAVIGALLSMEHRQTGRGVSQINAGAALDGLRFIRRSPLIWSTMLLDFIATFFAGSLLLLPIFADQLLQVGPRGLGLGEVVAGVVAKLFGARVSVVSGGILCIAAAAAAAALIPPLRRYRT